MPAEWEPHEATWLTWPHDESHWPGLYEKIPAIWATMVKELESDEDVHIAIHDDETEEIATLALKQAKIQGDRVKFHRIPNNFSWARDHGPIFVKNDQTKERMILDFRFNGWGNKWKHDLDDDVPKFVSKITNVLIMDVPMVFEGGSISVNGKGTLLTTESCLLHKNRNPEMTREQIEKNLKEYLGLTNVLWLGDGIEGDDTDGHVDDLTQFVNETTVVTIVEENPKDNNYIALQENLKRLQMMKDQDGTPLTIKQLPMPAPVVYEDTRLPATYANFYVGNSVVLMPVFDDPNDAKAISILQECFPTRRIVPIFSRELVWGFGAFHCVTQQMPA